MAYGLVVVGTGPITRPLSAVDLAKVAPTDITLIFERLA